MLESIQEGLHFLVGVDEAGDNQRWILLFSADFLAALDEYAIRHQLVASAENEPTGSRLCALAHLIVESSGTQIYHKLM
jgi:hypothetical protein